MASCPDEDLVVLVLTDPLVSLHEESKQEKSISATDIHNWDLPLILCSHVVKVQASRSRLTDQSSYFRGLLDGSFSESKLCNVSVQWNLETVISVLQSIYGCSVNVTSINILPLLEGAMFFGVEALLLVCETWLSEITFGRGSCPPQLPLVAIVKIWNFASENGIGFISELCTAYLARYFVWATSCSSFSDIPFDLINSCTEHPQLTVESEKQLCEALLVWLAGNVRSLECSSSKSGEDYVEILTKVRACLLPLAFVLGQRRNPYFSKIADKRVMDIFSPMNDYPSSLVNTIANNASDEFRVRLTKYSKKIDLSGFGCSTVALLFLSVFPQGLETTLQKGLIQYLNELNHCSGDNYQFSKYFFTTLSFESVHELDISKCLKLNFGAAIMLFHRAFPSLRVLKLSYCSKFKIGDLYHLIENCPLISDVDLTVDVSPLIPGQVSILSENTERYQVSDGTPYRASKEGSLFSSIANRTLETPFLSHIAKLTLEGRTDLSDLDLVHVSSLSGSLSYINLKGCTSITDVGISKLICQCISVDSMFVSYTSFGRNSVLALCSDYMFSNGSDDLKHSYTMASRLQRLHVDGCIGIDQTSMKRLMGHAFMLKSLSLRETSLLHDALYDFRGFSLEYLDVSETMASTAALTYVIRRSQGLRILKASSCRNLQHSQSSHSAFTADTISEDLYCELGRKCVLEEVSFGWGFSHFSLENMKPAMRETKTIMLGLGASLDQHALSLLPKICPLLEVVILKFQVISDDVLRSILGSLRNLRVLGLCCCPGDLTSHCFQIGMPHLRALRLERVTPWLTNDGLSILTQNCPNVVELSLSGCKHLNSDSQLIISSGWPGLAYLHLEDCGKVTSDGVSFLFDCKAVEDLLLRHNGQGIKRNFIADVASKMPLLRKIALDLCDALDGGFDSPGLHDRFGFSTIKIACCKRQRCGFDLQRLGKFWSVHKESVVLEWSSKELRTTIVKERV